MGAVCSKGELPVLSLPRIHPPPPPVCAREGCNNRCPMNYSTGRYYTYCSPVCQTGGSRDQLSGGQQLAELDVLSDASADLPVLASDSSSDSDTDDGRPCRQPIARRQPPSPSPAFWRIFDTFLMCLFVALPLCRFAALPLCLFAASSPAALAARAVRARLVSMQRCLMPVLFLLSVFFFELCLAPRGQPAGESAARLLAPAAAASVAASAAASSSGGSVGGGVLAVGAMAAAAAAFAMRGSHAAPRSKGKLVKGTFNWGAPRSAEGVKTSGAVEETTSGAVEETGSDTELEEDFEVPQCNECENDDLSEGDSMDPLLGGTAALCASDTASDGYDSDCDDSDLDEQSSCCAGQHSRDGAGTRSNIHGAGGKLWGPKQFPEGYDEQKNWDVENIRAAQAWECPCADRFSCIGVARLDFFELYEHRKRFQTATAPAAGGLRDGNRKEMEQHYEASTKTFMRAFKVGSLVDCCAASAGLAGGASFQSWAAARCDVKKGRPLKKGRSEARQAQMTAQRAHLRAYVRRLKGAMEGPKGGSDPNDKWRTAYMPLTTRYSQYLQEQTRLCQPKGGSFSLFKKVWNEFEDIVQEKASGHAKCEICGDHESRYDALEGRVDNEGRRLMKELEAEKAEHAAYHLGEREYAEDWYAYSESV